MEAVTKPRRPSRLPRSPSGKRESAALSAAKYVYGKLYANGLIARTALTAALDHDCLTLAQATAYSAIVALFPALIVAAAVVALLPATIPFRLQMAMFFNRVLPSNVSPLLQTYFVTTHSPQTARALAGSAIVSVIGAANVMSTMMESFRRAYDFPLAAATFWQRRRRALLLVPLSLLPMTLASILVVFGHLLAHALAGRFTGETHSIVLWLSFIVRWSVALGGSVAIIALIYHLGTDLSRHMREYVQPFLGFHMDWSWSSSLPGATFATALWFASTLLFGLYVTRFANYSQVYGSLGAAVALLFWLYLIALSVICGAEFNAQLAKAAQSPLQAGETVERAASQPAMRQVE